MAKGLSSGKVAVTMKDRQRILRNLVALVGIGKAAVIGAGVALAFVGYIDLAKQILPVEILHVVLQGDVTEAAAGIGGLIGVVVGLILSIIR